MILLFGMFSVMPASSLVYTCGLFLEISMRLMILGIALIENLLSGSTNKSLLQEMLDNAPLLLIGSVWQSWKLLKDGKIVMWLIKWFPFDSVSKKK